MAGGEEVGNAFRAQGPQSSRALGCLTMEPAEAGPLTSVLPGLAQPGTRFPILQQREPFKKRWFALDPQERRLLYYKNPLVRATSGPSSVHPEIEVESVLGGRLWGSHRAGEPWLVLCTSYSLPSPAGSPLCVSKMLPM